MADRNHPTHGSSEWFLSSILVALNDINRHLGRIEAKVESSQEIGYANREIVTSKIDGLHESMTTSRLSAIPQQPHGQTSGGMNLNLGNLLEKVMSVAPTVVQAILWLIPRLLFALSVVEGWWAAAWRWLLVHALG